MYTDFMTFSLDCLRVLLNDPLLILAFVRRNLAFSSYLRCLSDKFSAKTSINNVSSCVLVNWLFLASICTIGSDKAPFSHACTPSFNFRVNSPYT